jgi:hypothetical protein
MNVLKNYEKSSRVFSTLYEDMRALRSRGYSSDKGLGRKWKNWHNYYSSVVNFLAKSYQELEQYDAASVLLEDWLSESPNDASAKKLLEEIRAQVENN